MAQSGACQEAIWLQNIMREMGILDDKCMMLNADNQGAIRLIGNPEYHKRSKHIDIRYHWIRELIATKQIDIHYRPTAEMIADGLTKPLPKDSFVSFKHMLGVGMADRPNEV
jgi:hypothetical protein